MTHTERKTFDTFDRIRKNSKLSGYKLTGNHGRPQAGARGALAPWKSLKCFVH